VITLPFLFPRTEQAEEKSGGRQGRDRLKKRQGDFQLSQNYTGMLKKQATRSFWPKRKFFNSTTATKSLSSTRSYCGSPSDTSWFHAHQTLLEKNKKWVAEQRAIDPEFFTKLAKGQTPQFLWIGCSDSRVPANVITDMPPGSVFVHR